MNHAQALPTLRAILAAAAAALLLACAPAQAARLALVIGNNSYSDGPLVNPVNDARAMEVKLRALGFSVQKVENLRRNQIGRMLAAFAGSIKPGDEVLVFYAGHGMQVKGVNFLLAVDAEIATEDDVPLNSLNLNSLLDRLDEAKAGVKLIFLDACRNNPYSRGFRSAGSRGLARVADAPTGTLMHFATRPGGVSADGTGQNGLYTTELLRLIELPGIPVEQLLKRVAVAVETASKGQQEPWVEGSLKGDFYFKPSSLSAEPVRSAPAEQPALDLADLRQQALAQTERERLEGPRVAAMRRDFDSVTDFSGSAELRIRAWERFLAAWPESKAPGATAQTFRTQARQRMSEARQPAAAAVETTSHGIKDCADCPALVALPAGSFQMGSPAGEKDRYGDEGPVHEVRIGYRLAVGKYEVTRGEFARFVSATAYRTEAEQADRCTALNRAVVSAQRNWRQPGFEQTDDQPVVCVSWNDAQAYLKWLNKKSPGKGYRLLSEAEWEYAARAGSQTRFPWGDDKKYSEMCAYANGADSTAKSSWKPTWPVSSCSDGAAETASAEAYKPNAWGLYNMHGNTWEWVQDVYHESYAGAPTDGTAWLQGGEQGQRVLRGGAWDTDPKILRSADRSMNAPEVRTNNGGFRIARVN